MNYDSMLDAIAHQRDYPDLEADLAAHTFQRARVSAPAAFVNPGDIVLDVGCNSGYFASFVPHAAETHGVDINARLVDIAASRMTTARISTAECLPFPDRTFDVVNVSGVLEQCYDPVAVLHEATRVSRRLLTGTTTHESGTWGKHRTPVHPWQSHSFSRDELTTLLAACGSLTDLHTIDVNDPPEPQVWVWCVEVGPTKSGT